MDEATSITLRTKGELIQELIVHRDIIRRSLIPLLVEKAKRKATADINEAFKSAKKELKTQLQPVNTTVKVYDCVEESNYPEKFDRFTDEEENEIVNELKTFFEKHEYIVNIYFTYTYHEESRAAHYFLSLSIS